MLRIEPIEITRRELKLLLLAALLVPPLCTLAGALAMSSLDRSEAQAGASSPAAGDIVRAADGVPTLEFAPPSPLVSRPFTLMPSTDMAFEFRLLMETLGEGGMPDRHPAATAEALTGPVAPDADMAQARSEPAPAAADASADEAVAAAPQESSLQAAQSLTGTATVAPSRNTLPATSDNGHFVVQAGVFAKESNARRCREALLRRGVISAVIAHAGARATAFHVVLGRYESWRAAERARRQLAAALQIELIATRLPMRSIAEQVAAI